MSNHLNLSLSLDDVSARKKKNRRAKEKCERADNFVKYLILFEGLIILVNRSHLEKYLILFEGL